MSPLQVVREVVVGIALAFMVFLAIESALVLFGFYNLPPPTMRPFKFDAGAEWSSFDKEKP